MKKLVVLLLIASLVAGGLFAQEVVAFGSAVLRISADMGLGDKNPNKDSGAQWGISPQFSGFGVRFGSEEFEAMARIELDQIGTGGAATTYNMQAFGKYKPAALADYGFELLAGIDAMPSNFMSSVSAFQDSHAILGASACPPYVPQFKISAFGASVGIYTDNPGGTTLNSKFPDGADMKYKLFPNFFVSYDFASAPPWEDGYKFGLGFAGAPNYKKGAPDDFGFPFMGWLHGGYKISGFGIGANVAIYYAGGPGTLTTGPGAGAVIGRGPPGTGYPEDSSPLALEALLDLSYALESGVNFGAAFGFVQDLDDEKYGGGGNAMKIGVGAGIPLVRGGPGEPSFELRPGIFYTASPLSANVGGKVEDAESATLRVGVSLHASF